MNLAEENARLKAKLREAEEAIEQADEDAAQADHDAEEMERKYSLWKVVACIRHDYLLCLSVINTTYYFCSKDGYD